MANTLATSTWLVRETALGFLNSLKFVSNLNREYNDDYKVNGTRVGNTVKVKLPQRWQVKDGQALQTQSLLDQTVDVTLTNQKQVSMDWSSAQATTEINSAREQYVVPAANALANAADIQAYDDIYKDIWNNIGTPGTATATNLEYLQAVVKIVNGSPATSRFCAVLDPSGMASIVNANLALFNPASDISREYKTGMFGRDALGIDEWYQDQNAPVFTTGSATTAATPLVAGANQTGSSLLTDGWASGATQLRKGDIITLAGVFSVNPESFRSTGQLQQFVVTADIADTTGDITIPISPSIITSGQLQTVTNSPANDAVITYWSMSAGGTQAATTSRQSIVFHRDLGTFAFADMVKPNAGAKASYAQSKEFNVSIRLVEQYDVQSDSNITRLDMLIGAAMLQGRLGCRVQGA